MKGVKLFSLLLMFSFGIVFVVYKMSNTSAVAISEYKVMKAVLESTVPPDGDYLADERSGYQTYRAFGRKMYKSKLSRMAVVNYYSEYFERSGWSFFKRSDRDFYFCKGERVMVLDFTDVSTTEYTVGFLLDGNKKSSVAWRDCS